MFGRTDSGASFFPQVTKPAVQFVPTTEEKDRNSDSGKSRDLNTSGGVNYWPSVGKVTSETDAVSKRSVGKSCVVTCKVFTVRVSRLQLNSDNSLNTVHLLCLYRVSQEERT